MKKYLSVMLALCAVQSPNPRAEDWVEDSGAWLQAVGEGSLGAVDPSWTQTRLWLEGQSRFDAGGDHWYQGMVRAALGYALTERATVWAGYTYLPTQNLGKPAVQQQDAWPGFRYVLPTEWGTLSLRTLLELNFLPGNHGEVRVRPRQMIRLMHPLGFEPRLSVIGWDEFFVRLNDTPSGGESGFDQNRAFAGLGWSFSPSVRVELGYMNQYLDDARHLNHTMRHLVMGSVLVNF